MKEKFLRALSGVDNLKGIFWGRVTIGFFLIIYGFAIFSLNSIEQWTKISLAVAFWGIGLSFVFEGQSALREYFTNKEPVRRAISQPLPFIEFFGKLFFVSGGILFLVKFYVAENISFYPIVIFLILLFIIITFKDKISHFELSKNKLLIKMKEDQEKNYDKLEPKKKEWNFEIKGVNKNV